MRGFYHRISLFGFLMVLGLGVPLLNAQEPERPNILWIIAEDLGKDLSVYGTPQVITPRLDQFAREGVLYQHFYTTAPVCSPSRSAFMTGMYQTSIGAHNHRSHRDDGYRLPSGVRVITDHFREVGYFTANIRALTEEPEERFYRGTGKTDWNFTYEGEPFDSDRWADLKNNQPFYAQINFPETHRGRDWDEADLHIEKTADPDKVQIPPYYPDHPVTRKDWAQYLNAVMALDKKVGYVLDLLEKDGLSENTIVFFFGDHGRAMIRAKQWPYESGLNPPLIIRWPKSIPKPEDFHPGSISDQLIASIDLSTTCLKLCGIDPPLTMQGRVFLGREKDPPRKYVFGGRDRGDETVDRIRTVRDSRFRYIRNFYPNRPFLQLNRYKEWTYPVIAVMRRLHEEGKLNPVQARLLSPTRPKEELYDLENDPYEIHNLAGLPDYEQVKSRLSAVLDAWIIETNDQGRFPEDPSIHEYWEKQMKENYEGRPKKVIH